MTDKCCGRLGIVIILSLAVLVPFGCTTMILSLF
jgi:hypothetical protein